MKFPEYKSLDLPGVAEELPETWRKEGLFEQSITSRDGRTPFVFFEGPPSANGLPGIHHVMARTIKDIFCRYKTLRGFQVKRKAGWDTHGLPVELGVEKELGITKEDIGTKISVEEYNMACREAVMRYTDIWDDLTRKMGYWVDMDNPYVTYENKYIESVWWLLAQLHKKRMLYKGYSIQPYSPKAGTGLSSHELNQPGCYRDVKDTSAITQFELTEESKGKLEASVGQPLSGLVGPVAWTTTPWTLPSNTALAVGPDIVYQVITTTNRYDQKPITIIIAEALVGKYFHPEKGPEFTVLASLKGKDLVGLRYHQLLPFVKPAENLEGAFRIIEGDFVTTEEGTGIVHIAPTFGADDMRVAKAAGVPPMLVSDEHGKLVPLVDLQGRFTRDMGSLAGKYVKNEYYPEGEAPDKSVDVEISIMLKEQGKAFLVEKYEHSYPHCWRTDKPILYYPLDSWFIRATADRERMVELNKTIQWKPASTGTGRFGNWLENLNDWNLSRSRYWGIPLPIWRSEDGEEVCVESVEQLKALCQKSTDAGFMSKNPLADFEPGNMSTENYLTFDLHKHVTDKIVLVSSAGKPMHREADLIDVWFDSGAMPYAQWHYPFENKELIDGGKFFPADFIAEGVDQTRGWFYTLHAIATMCFDSVAYKTVVSNGLVLDKNGQKMSKRLGNAVDPFDTLKKYGPDATRWYMITNAQPWDNLKFDIEGIVEAQRKFFGTLHNTYAFFALYANLDGFRFQEAQVPVADRPEADRWILSALHTLIVEVTEAYDNYEPTKAGRLIQDYTTELLSNWYVRLNRRRFWKGEYGQDKLAAYQTLYTCLETLSILASPIAPFITDRMYRDLNNATGRLGAHSVHLADFPVSDQSVIDSELEKRMEMARVASSIVLGLRRKEKIRVRQPLSKVLIPVPDTLFEQRFRAVEQLFKQEVNVKEIEYLSPDNDILVKSIKANFKTLGPKYGKLMKAVAAAVAGFNPSQIARLESGQSIDLVLEGEPVVIAPEDADITTKDVPGHSVGASDGLTVAIDIRIDDTLRAEGLARELVNRIQNLRKDSGFEVTDRISVRLSDHPIIHPVLTAFGEYIKAEVLADSLDVKDLTPSSEPFELDEGIAVHIAVEKSV
jgi:isoleucyl-tRNA synthetase